MDKTIQLFKEKRECSACGACFNICPKQAIQMRQDEYGFLYPEIDSDLCVKCGKCISVCHLKQDSDYKVPLDIYAACAKKKEYLLTSASGGIFAVLAEEILKNQGVVAGCAMVYENDKLAAKHILIDHINDLKKLQGSKYVQSDIGTIYQSVQEALEKEKQVLFSGTPCQVDGLYGYLQKEYDNLFTVDIICHGVPSKQMFQDYIEYTENKAGKKIVDFSFRSKIRGWGLHGVKVFADENNMQQEESFNREESSYYTLFLSSKIYRESCYACKYAGKKRVSNITIGDYWGVYRQHPEIENIKEFDKKLGISVMLVNDEKGRQFVHRVKQKLALYESSYEKAARHNGQLRRPSVKPKNRDKILEKYRRCGYASIERYYFRKKMKQKVKQKIKKLLGRI